MVLIKLYFTDGTDKTYRQAHQWFVKEGFLVIQREDGFDYFRRDLILGMQERKLK